MSDTPKTDLIEAEYWDTDLNARDVFERMGDMEAELAAEQESFRLYREKARDEEMGLHAEIVELKTQLAAALEESRKMRIELEVMRNIARRVPSIGTAHSRMEIAEELFAAERARTKELVEGIKSILPKPPYHPLLEPEWVYLSELVGPKGE